MGKITHFRCSSVLKYNGYRPNHGNRFMDVAGLRPYDNKGRNILYFGCYNQSDIKHIMNNRGEVVIYWAGSDITIARKMGWKFKPSIRHATGTELAARELAKMGIKAVVRPVAEIDPKKIPLMPMGKSVFCYLPGKRREFYGYHTIKAVAARLPNVKFILTRYAPRSKPFSNAEVHTLVNFPTLSELYKKSVCCIRPTRHDGMSQTIFEVGLAGRRTAHPHKNGWGVLCTTVGQYVKFIQNELKEKKPHIEERNKVIAKVNNFDFLGR